MPSNLAVLGPGGTITDCGRLGMEKVFSSITNLSSVPGTSEASGAGATGGETDLQLSSKLDARAVCSCRRPDGKNLQPASAVWKA